MPPPEWRPPRSSFSMKQMKLEDLKRKSPAELVTFAEETGVENASTLRKQELMFATLKQLATQETEITATGVVEVLQDGFGFLRSPEANYLPGSDRRYGRRPDSFAEGRRALFRAAQSLEHQLRRPRKGQAQEPFRQPDAALSDEVAEARDRRSDDQRFLFARHRYRVAAR